MKIEDRIQATRGRSSGFDFLRIILSFSVMMIHTVVLCYGVDYNDLFYAGPLGPFARFVVPSFFALSGFLVAGSLVRTKTIGMFLGLRVIRIYPALIMEVLLSALVIGPLLTTFSLSAYFSDSTLAQYLWNAIGHIHYELPGLFLDNPLPKIVNGSLWTVPYELLCYISLTAIILVVGVKRKALVPIAAVALTIGFILLRLHKYHGSFPVLKTALPGALLVATYLFGVAIFLYRDKLPWNAGWFAISLVFSLVVLSSAVPYGEYAAPLPIAYATVWLGLTNARRPSFLKHADYSYGVYLYGYVIQQAIVSLFPWSRHWYLNGLICIPLAIAFATFSWEVIEKRALKLRQVLTRLEGAYLEGFAKKQAKTRA